MSSTAKDVVYMDEPWVYLRWDAAHNCVHNEWRAFANSVEFRATLMKALEAVRETHSTGYVSDTRKIKVIVHEDQKFATETVVPLMAAAGMKRVALVTADAGLGKVTVDEIVRMVDNKPLLMRTFDSMPAALKWVSEA